MKWKKILKKTWNFIWNDNSIWSWIVNVILAFILIKYIVYPGLGLLLGTGFPIVAVVSSSMEHNNNLDEWFSQNDYYTKLGISKDDFKTFPFKNGFNKGDIMILKGIKPEDVGIGMVIVFKDGKPDPFIHRVILKWKDDEYHFQTKGDNNPTSIKTDYLDETDVKEEQLIGKAVFRIPFLGYIKIWFVELLRLLHII